MINSNVMENLITFFPVGMFNHAGEGPAEQAFLIAVDMINSDRSVLARRVINADAEKTPIGDSFKASKTSEPGVTALHSAREILTILRNDYTRVTKEFWRTVMEQPARTMIPRSDVFFCVCRIAI